MAGLVDTAPEPDDRPSRSQRLARILIIPLAAVFIVLLVAVGFLYDFGVVKGESMLPDLRDYDYLVITRGWADPRPGDVVVMRIVVNGVPDEIVKRVIAVAGQRVVVRGDRVWVDGRAEPFSRPRVISTAILPALDRVVPPGDVFVLGDNRPVSDDSRTLGMFPVSDVHGKVLFRWAPLWRMGVIPSR